MAFENIGLGGVLSFDSKGAVTNMGAASRAFNVLGRSATSAQASVSRIASGMGAFTLIGGGGLVAAGLGLKSLVKEGVAWNAQMQSSEISIGTILAAVTKTPLADNIKLANTELQRLNVIAAEAPGETQDIIDIFSRLAGPLIAAGASMKDLEDGTKATAIMAGSLHLDFKQTAHAMSLLAGGTMRQGENLVQMLHSMGLLHESTQEWKALLPEQRLKRIKEILATFSASGELVGKTWEAQTSTTKSLVKIMAGAFTKNMFSNASASFGNFNDYFFKHQDEILKRIGDMGTKFSEVIAFMVSNVKLFIANMQTAIGWVEAQISRLGLGIDSTVLKRVMSIIAQFVLMATAISPIIAIIGFVASKVAALWSIVSGVLGLLSAFALPLAAIAAAVGGIYLLFKQTGEGPVDFFWRTLEYIKETLNEIWYVMQDGVATIIAGFSAIGQSASLMWQDMSVGMDYFMSAMQGLVDITVQVFGAIADLGGIIVEGLAATFEAIREPLASLFNAIMNVFDSVVEMIQAIIDPLMNVLRPVAQAIMFIFEKLAMVIMKFLGIFKPVLDGIAYLFREVIKPIAVWLIETFGPPITAIFEAIAWVVGKIADALGWVFDKCGSLLEIVGTGLKYAFEAIGVVVKAIGWVLENLIINPIKWLADKLIWVAKKMQEISSGPLMDILNQETEKANAILDKLHAEGKYYYTVQEMIAAQMEQANKALQDVNASIAAQAQAIQMLNGLAANFNASTIKPLADLGISIIQAATGTKIFADKGDVSVDVNVNNKMSMCINGRQMSAAQAEYNTEVSERSGFNKAPWQQQRVQIAGTTQTGSKADNW